MNANKSAMLHMPSLSLALGALIASACSPASADPVHAEGHTRPSRPMTSVRVEAARSDALASEYVATGTIHGVNTATIASRMVGYVRTLDVSVGGRVERGQLLATLDDADPRAGLAQARAGTEVARAAEGQIEQQSQAAEANLRIAATTNERMQGLRSDRAVSQQQADEARAAFDAAQAQFSATRSGLAQATSRIAQSQAALASARAVLDYTRVRAPFAGRVLSRPAQVGDLAAPGATLYVIEQDSGLRVEVAVPESLSASVALGATVQVRIDAVGRSFEGTVGEIAPHVDPVSRAFLVQVDLPTEALSGLDAGMFARVSVPRPAVETLTVPLSAISERGSLDRVFVVGGDRAELRLVTRGARHGDRVSVLSGLSTGETVVVSPSASLRDRDPVRRTQ